VMWGAAGICYAVLVGTANRYQDGDPLPRGGPPHVRFAIVVWRPRAYGRLPIVGLGLPRHIKTLTDYVGRGQDDGVEVLASRRKDGRHPSQSGPVISAPGYTPVSRAGQWARGVPLQRLMNAVCSRSMAKMRHKWLCACPAGGAERIVHSFWRDTPLP